MTKIAAPQEGATQASEPAHKVLHATAVSFDGSGVLIRGKSGSGKSALGLELIAIGAALVADDQVALQATGRGIEMLRPPTLPEAIEARGVGLLRMPCFSGPVSLKLVVDLDTVSAARLPPSETTDLLGWAIPRLHKVEGRYFPSAIKAYLSHGRIPV